MSELYPGVPYRYSAVAPDGAIVFAAGACPLDPEGEIVAPGNHEAQARQTIENLRLALEEAGSDLARVLKTTVYVASDDRAVLVRVWKVVEAAFGRPTPPSTLLGVGMLGYPEQLVEIEAVALLSDP